ncbi:conserved hypothetical protein [Deferribacter desulfuricans SSM1]|uniref:PAC domain-containing protein n=1 Tax=Deferribacter desulfuricans (strain DSM 14783 / JCM 11476 / NBRC 101012 / SSM1) TaxID=639282 RepID=D3PAG9_DEFDS|nr:PAS domain-containing protein [Deferribacter desulfuricans]BAI79592.1 conserved hypothetical protein [Deferribacter desulfuricans SSM1]
MSEFIGNLSENSYKVFNLTKELIEGAQGKLLYNKYEKLISEVTPLDVMIGFDLLIKEDFEMNSVKIAVSKALNLFFKSLTSYPIPDYNNKSILFYLHKHNLKLQEKLKKLKILVKEVNHKQPIFNTEKLLFEIDELIKFTTHYHIKENILFPIIEKYFQYHGCLKIMWSIHDDIRKNLKTLQKLIESDDSNIEQFNTFIGKIFFDMHTLIFRENHILYPICYKYIDKSKLEFALIEAIDIGFHFINIDKSILKSIKLKEKTFDKIFDNLIDLDTGQLNVEQIKLIFNNLPVDITFVDENDTVRYFSTPKDRIFVRTKAIIGRKVQNCHPHESVHIVNKIIEAFKNGEKDNATFWIQMAGKFILIQYFAIRDDKGIYKGLIEVTQDITDIKKLEGEQRLLDWDNE